MVHTGKMEHSRKTSAGPGPMPGDGIGSSRSTDESKSNRYDEGVISVAKYGDEVGDQVDRGD